MNCKAPLKPKQASRYNEKTPAMIRRDCLRRNVVAYMHECEQQRIVKQQERETKYEQDILQLQDMCRNLFEKWQERCHQASMLAIESIKPFYEKTYSLKKCLEELEKQRVRLNLRIASKANVWIRRTTLQNFHYQLLETGSNDKWPAVEIPKFDSNDAWAIKSYYENVFRKNRHPAEIIFPDTEAFKATISQLQSTIYISMRKLHYSLMILVKSQHKHAKLEDNLTKYIKHTTEMVGRFEDGLHFVEDRARKIESETTDLIDAPLRDSIGLPLFRTIHSLCDILYVEVIPEHIRNDVKDDCSASEKMEMVFGTLINVLDKLDRISTEKRKHVENVYRKKLAYNTKQSLKACLIEKQIERNVVQIKRNLK